ncbi:MAG: nuclease-related domain-containing protein [Kiritimatiellae bacterium]|nr:nuclease-related domain-containing protein [Kiritimatiellia bacterium]
MAVIATLLHVQIPIEIIGLTGLVFAFWIITEAMSGKSTATSSKFDSSVRPETDGADRVFHNLPQDCTVFHNINTGYGYIEYILLSKEHGLFIIETKQLSGKVTSVDSLLAINNLTPEQDFFVKILWNSLWLREHVLKSTKLDATITSVVIFVNATVDVTEPINGVIITNPESFPAILRKVKTNPNISSNLWALHKSGVQIW